MKTTNNLQKTENRKFRVNISKTFAAVASLVLISLTVSANGFWKQVFVNNSFGKMAMIMVDQTTENDAAPVAVESHATVTTDVQAIAARFSKEAAKDKSLEIENWMVKTETFGTNGFAAETVVEEPLQMEGWMIDNDNFAVSSGDTDRALKLESWMTNNNVWVN